MNDTIDILSDAYVLTANNCFSSIPSIASFLWIAACWLVLFLVWNCVHAQNTCRSLVYQYLFPNHVICVMQRRNALNSCYLCRWFWDMRCESYLACNSGTVYTRLWLYWTTSENRSAKLLSDTSPLPRLMGLSRMLVRGLDDDIMSMLCTFTECIRHERYNYSNKLNA